MQIVAEDGDPAAEKKASKGSILTDDEKLLIEKAAAERAKRNALEFHASEFIERYAKPKNKSWEETQRQFKATINPALGDRDIASITKRDIIELLDTIVDRGSPLMANRILSTLKKFFGWLCERDTVVASPTAGIGKPSAEKSRDRFLLDHEIRLLWKVSHEIEYPFGPFVRLLIITGQRLNEVAGMKRDELSLGTINPEWTKSKTRTKNNKAHVVALAPSAVSLINELPPIGEDGFVFTTTGRTQISGFSKAKTIIDEALLAAAKKQAVEAGDDPDKVTFEPWVFHDLRRTMASGMARLGITLPTIERCLNHVSGSFGGIVGVYQQHEYRTETRQAFIMWAKLVDDIIHDRVNANIVQIAQGQ